MRDTIEIPTGWQVTSRKADTITIEREVDEDFWLLVTGNGIRWIAEVYRNGQDEPIDSRKVFAVPLTDAAAQAEAMLERGLAEADYRDAYRHLSDASYNAMRRAELRHPERI